MSARCPVCDRETCPLPEARRVLQANSVAHTRKVTEATLAAQSGHLAAQRDCAAHAVDWRARCLAAEAAQAEAEARLAAVVGALVTACDIADRWLDSINVSRRAIGLPAIESPMGHLRSLAEVRP